MFRYWLGHKAQGVGNRIFFLKARSIKTGLRLAFEKQFQGHFVNCPEYHAIFKAWNYLSLSVLKRMPPYSFCGQGAGSIWTRLGQRCGKTTTFSKCLFSKILVVSVLTTQTVKAVLTGLNIQFTLMFIVEIVYRFWSFMFQAFQRNPNTWNFEQME